MATPAVAAVKNAEKAVVRAANRTVFSHFWLANVEKKLLVVAIPKVTGERAPTSDPLVC